MFIRMVILYFPFMRFLNDLNGFVGKRACVHSSPEHWPVVKIVAAYEDLRTGILLRDTLERLSNQFQCEFTIESHVWKFEVLDAVRLRKMASDEGSDAEILMISTRAEYDLPGSVQAWLETSLIDRPALPLALVALML